MIEIQMYGSNNSTYEYVKLLLNRKIEILGLPVQVQELKDITPLIAANTSALTAIKIGNTTPLYINNIDDSLDFVESVIKKIIGENGQECLIDIVVPIDMSPCSVNALEYAIFLAKIIKSPLKIVHYFNHIITSEELTRTVNQNIQQIRKDQFEELVSRIKQKHNTDNAERLNIESEFIVGEVVDEVVKLSQVNKRQLLVMGSKGAGNLSKAIFGSKVLQAARQVDCPIMIIPENYRDFRFEKISVALEHYLMNKQDLGFLQMIVEKSGVELELVTVTNQEEDMALWESKINKGYLKNAIKGKTIYNTNILKGLENHIKEGTTDILVMTPKKKNVFDKIFNRSISKGMALISNIPLLVLNHKCNCKEGSNCCKINRMAQIPETKSAEIG